jgi:hypothetical protein
MLNVLPPWIAIMDDGSKELHARIFFLRLAALMATPSGTLPALSQRLGKNPNYLSHLISPGRGMTRALIEPQDAIRIENMLGRDLLPRERLRPDIFCLPAS